MEYTLDTESPDNYHFWTAITILGAITKRQVYLDMNMFKVYPNFYVFLIGPPAARKSAAAAIGVRLAVQAGLRKFSDKITDAALIKDLSEATEKRVEGQTVELCSPVLIYASELGVFMGLDAYSSGVIADLTDLYDCPPRWEKKTISRDSELILGPYVTLFAAGTPQTLKDVIPSMSVGQGFTSRILFIWAPKRRKRVPMPKPNRLETLLVSDLKLIGKLRGQFKFSDDGWKAYQKQYMERPEPEEEFEDERMHGYASRKDTHLLKISMVLSLADKDELIITEKEVSAAIDSLKWMETGLSNVFAGHGSATTSQDVVRIFKQVQASMGKVGYINHKELVKRNFAQVGVHELDLVIHTLEGAGAIMRIVGKDPRSGATEIMFKVIDNEFLGSKHYTKPKSLEED